MSKNKSLNNIRNMYKYNNCIMISGSINIISILFILIKAIKNKKINLKNKFHKHIFEKN